MARLRAVSYYLYGLEKGSHVAEITVKSGEFGMDCVEVIGGEVITAPQTVHTGAEDVSEDTSSETAADNTTSAVVEKSTNDTNNAGVLISVGAGLAIVGGVVGTVLYKKKRRAKTDKK